MLDPRSRRALFTGLLILVIGVIGLPAHSATAPVRAQNPCEGLVTPRLTIGGSARVTSPYGLSLKNQPMTGAAGATEVMLMAYGSVATVLDGYRCNLGYIWWELSLPDGSSGWAAEGDKSGYFMEPYTVGLHLYRRNADGTQIAHYFVTPDGAAQLQGVFTIAPVTATPRDAWQEVEIERLGQALDSLRSLCPARLAGTPFANVDLDGALSLALPPLEYDFYPSPDGTRLLLVRHLHLLLPRCDTVVPERVGISRVSVLDASGAETLLFPFPQHGSVPASEDRYAPGEPDAWNVYLDEVTWSPQGKYIAFVAAYRDQCSGQPCYRFQLYISNLDTGQLYILGEGRHVGWTNGGEGINVFRLVTGEDGRQVARLFTMRPDGNDRQEIWLPGGAVYVSDSQQGLGLPWNDSGARVMVANAGMGEVMLFNLSDRAFTPAITVPDLMPQPNRLSVDLIQGETAFLWTTIRGEFVTQNVHTGDWVPLHSDLATTGVAPVRVRPFATGSKALVEMADGTVYVLDINTDQLIPVAIGG
jgi:hypothetical protein